MATIDPERLRQLRTFAAFDQPLLQRLAQVLHYQHCAAGSTVFAQRDDAREVYVVLSGHLRIAAWSRAGREVVFHDLYPGDLVGELSAVDGAPRGAGLVAVSDAELGWMDASAFNGLLGQEPAFARLVIERLTRLVRALNRRILLLAAPVPIRVYAELARIAEHRRLGENSARLTPPPKHADIANRINTHREAVSRALAELHSLGIIARGQGELLILDLAALREHAEGKPLPTGKAAPERADGLDYRSETGGPAAGPLSVAGPPKR